MDTVFFLSVGLTIFLCGTPQAFSEQIQGSRPSAETLRRYLALYEGRPHLDRYKPGLYELRDPDNAGELPNDSPLKNIESKLEQYRAQGKAYFSPPTRSGWTGPGQPEFVAVDSVLPELQDDRSFLEVDYTPQDTQQDTAGDSESTRTQPDNVISDRDSQQSKKSEQKTSDGSRSTSSFIASTNQDDGLPFAQPFANPETKNPLSDVYFVVIVAGCSAAAVFGVIAAGYCFYRFQKNSKAAAEVDYPAYGVTGPNKDQTSPNGDRRLAQSAQMYHYQHQKQQMIAVEKATTARNTSASDIDSEEENEEGDYTVYECPGLAPTGEMEVKNPLFQDDSTPMSPPVVTAKDTKKT